MRNGDAVGRFMIQTIAAAQLAGLWIAYTAGMTEAPGHDDIYRGLNRKQQGGGT
ncbi:hypothetical protein [Bradyrhizobium sp. 131]|uniref:hypothetical protein n=1 Tax=Bradyrhizobium sp. 131 TaxID=2782609 RepID=UPI001FFE8893|nr:hypothetical protein [Bradyrhizobium sp. 131]UPK20594.1 hypothetical protein IVA73_06185 [Bradyrhizobium sp. 131]